MKLRPDTGLTFDDVLLVPKRSSIRSRLEVDTSTFLVPGIRMAVPIISSNMDTVTEATMAIALAKAGGIGIIHRFMPIEKQVGEVQRVKRSESFVVENPITISLDESLADARQKMIEADIGGLAVVDDAGQLLGLLTTRDILLASDLSMRVREVMTPRERLVVASEDEPLDDARLKLYEHRIEKLPLVDAEDRIVGLITAQDIIKLQRHPHATKDEKGRLRVGVAVGVRAEDYQRAAACVEAGADVLVVDVAHGHADHALEMVGRLKSRFPAVPLIAGNVATADGVLDLADAGADAVKVGVGSGSICITRLVTGYGIPQLTAISDCAQAGRSRRVPIIADGGIRTSGDLAKALAAGASSVMLGSALAGTDESPGAAIVRGGRRYKLVRGMASLTANVDRVEIDRKEYVDDEEWREIVPEGVEAVVPYRGSVEDILLQFVGGLRSGMSYAGAKNIEMFWEKAEFIRITAAGKTESGVHDVDVL
jgi:IMP dehydrogenase